MNSKEIKARIGELLSAGTKKAEVFDQLRGQGLKDARLALLIAAYPDPIRCRAHAGKVRALIAVMLLQSALAFLLGYAIGSVVGPKAAWLCALFLALIPLLFAWGFRKHRVGYYNAYILLSIAQFSQSFRGFAANPVGSSIGIAIGLGLIAWVWYVRDKIFPGFVFVAPRQVKGKYLFVD